MSDTIDRYADGTRAITQVLRPRFPGWREIPVDRRISNGGVVRMFLHAERCLSVISAVEVVRDDGPEKGPEYHLSVAVQTVAGPARCDSSEARWVLHQFGMDGADEDNHVPGGVVRNFWRPVADCLVGMECPCKAEEPAIVEDKGDFVWRP